MLKKYDQVFPGIKYHIKENGEYEKDYKKIKFLSDDAIPLNKMIYSPTKKNGGYYPQVYLDDCFYEL